MVSNRIIRDITDFIFVDDELIKADIIFIPGSTADELPREAARLYSEGYAPIIMPSGKYAKGSDAFSVMGYETEADYFADILKKNGVPDSAILKEDKAEFTCQNALFSRELCDKAGIFVKRAIICCKAYHARRCLMYYTFAFPDTEFIIHPVNVKGITRDNWTEIAPDVIMSEVEKCGGQIFEDFEKYIKTAE